MLKQRIITAVALLLVLLGVLFYPAHWPFAPWIFAAFMAVVIACAAWEWARLCGREDGFAKGYATGVTAGCVLGTFALGALHNADAAIKWGLTLVSVLWVFLGGWMLNRGVPVWRQMGEALRLSMGCYALWAAWLAAVQLHSRFGVWFLLSVLALVWVADIAAYFFGRALGKRKLAPAISPGKTWAGAIGGATCVVLFAVACSLWLPVGNFYATLREQGGWAALVAVALVLTVLGVMGDLIESLMKRSVGMKDSSQLLPGHGGVLDRIDALLPVLPMGLAVLLWIDSMPVIG